MSSWHAEPCLIQQWITVRASMLSVIRFACTNLISSLLSESYVLPLKLVPRVFIAILSLMRLLYTPLTCMHSNMSVYLCVPACHRSHTYMGLVNTGPNPERPESSRRSLGLGPLQLATGSHDSNNRVASQLQGTAKLFPQRSQIGGKWVIMGSEIEWMITALQSFK